MLPDPLKRFRIPGGFLLSLSALLVLAVSSPADVRHGGPATEDQDGSAPRIGAILSLKGEITDVTAESLERRIDEVRGRGAEVIVIELDTPGGMVTSSIAIADLLREMDNVKTVAWVNPNAHSGGTIVAVAADEIVMARSSRMGSAQVIMGTPVGVEAVPEDLEAKAMSPVLADFRASCKRNGYSQVLCEAFVKPDREVWWIENKETGERKFVFRKEKLRLVGRTDEDAAVEDDEAGNHAADVSTDAAEATEDESAGNTEPGVDGSGVPGPSKNAGSNAEHAWELVRKYFDPVLDVDVDVIQPVVRDDQLLEVSAGEAYAYGFNKAIISDEAQLKARYGLSEIIREDASWSENLAQFMTSAAVRGFLLLIVFLGAYVEFHTPGVGVPGLVALICLGIFVAAPYMTGLANIWEILLIALGILLLLLELFVIPGFGVAGISGIILILAGMLATFVPEEPGQGFPLLFPRLPETLDALKVGAMTVVSALGTSLVGMFLLSKYLPKTPFFARIVPDNPTPSSVIVDDAYRGAARVGDEGTSATPLHPGGRAKFQGVLVDVVTQGEYVETNRPVEVIERRGNHVVVREKAS
ncbi:MAG: ATP-dependent Clp protease proteolytic subunit [Phycisphaerae bacterium]|nr:ATP-dependent Clp protease proteolytic subunit [Phycisphaerae bacterium]